MGRRQRGWDFIDVVNQEEAERISAPYLSMLRGCIEDGLRAVESHEKSDPEFFLVYPAGPRATIVFWQIVHRAETRFQEVEGSSVSHNRGFLTILVADKLEIRFKKLNRKGLSRNYPTKAQGRYSLQLRLAGMEEPTHQAGYQLNKDGSLRDILMVCPRGQQDVEWSFSMPVDSSELVAHPARASGSGRGRKAEGSPKAGLTMSRFNPEMLELARESRGLTQSALSDHSGVDQGNISKYERGFLEISSSALEKLAAALRYPLPFFFRIDEVRGLGNRCLHNRKRQSMPVGELRTIQARVNIIRMHAATLLSGADIVTDNRMVRKDIGDGESPEDIARYIRATWDLPLGPIKNLVRSIERAGGIVFRCTFGTKKLDAVSQWCQGLPPMMFVNAETPGDRARWTLAHELGHIVMHRIPSEDAEREADLFASEFLMPSRDILADLNHFNITRAAMLKPYWKVSMAALAMKANRLGKISDWQKTDFFRELSYEGMRTKEPDTVPVESPTVIKDLIELHMNQLGYSISDLANLLTLEENELRSLCLGDSENHMGLRVVS